MHGEALRFAGLIPVKRGNADKTDELQIKKPRNGATTAVRGRGYQGGGYRGAGYSTFSRSPSLVGNRDRGSTPDFSWQSHPEQRPNPKPADASSANVAETPEDNFPALGPSGKESRLSPRQGNQGRPRS